MDKEKVEKVDKLIRRIDRALVELTKLTGANHISAFITKYGVSIDDFTDLEHSKFSYFREVKK